MTVQDIPRYDTGKEYQTDEKRPYGSRPRGLQPHLSSTRPKDLGPHEPMPYDDARDVMLRQLRGLRRLSK